MKVLTVKQPWASAIINDGKDIENRSRPTKYRGPLYIHAGKAWAKEALSPIEAITGKSYVFGTDYHGMVIGAVDVIDCHHADECRSQVGLYTPSGDGFCSEWAMPDHYHWVLTNPQSLTFPFAAKGQLGIWNLEAPAESGPSEITPYLEHLARRAILNEIEDVTDAMIQAYEEVIRIDPEWEL